MTHMTLPMLLRGALQEGHQKKKGQGSWKSDAVFNM